MSWGVIEARWGTGKGAQRLATPERLGTASVELGDDLDKTQD